MVIDHNRTLRFLQAHRGRWVRPATNAQLLSLLFLSLKGFAVAVRVRGDSYKFRVADHVPVSQGVIAPVKGGAPRDKQSLAVAC
jgi:hypothetical protein